MAFILMEFENLEFEIRAKKGGTIIVSLPPADALRPSDIDKINRELKQLRESGVEIPEWKDPNKVSSELLRFTLAHFNKGDAQRAAIAELTKRDLKQIDHLWGESVLSLGESEDSTPSSSESVE